MVRTALHFTLSILHFPRVLPFPRDGYGQDDEWVTANFTNSTEILAVGYPQWVDAQVGEGLTNGLYKFTATVPDVPPETIQLKVGNYSVAVTNAGDYVFLLEKGVDYEYGTVPQIHLSLDVPDAILLNSNVVSTAKVAVASWSFSSDVPTSGVVTVSCISGADKVECQGLLGSWDVDDAFSVTSHVAGVSTSAAIGDVVLMAEFSSYGGTNAVSRGMTVVRAGNVTIPAAPTNGLVVLVNTPVTMMMDCEPEGAGAFLTTMWHARRLKSDGTYEEWQLAAYGQRGVATVFTPTQGGIYQVRSRGWFNSYPPLANDWANPAYAIGNWVPLLSGEYPEPGYVSADPDPDTSGHMGIIDFDGSGISAGTANVNRHFDSCAPGIVIRKLEE